MLLRLRVFWEPWFIDPMVCIPLERGHHAKRPEREDNLAEELVIWLNTLQDFL